MKILVVSLDVGETLVNERRLWRASAAYLGVTFEELCSVLEDVIAKGDQHRKALQYFRPGLDVEAARRERAASGDLDCFDATDLYPDALPCLHKLQKLGFVIGIAKNEPIEAESTLKNIGLVYKGELCGLFCWVEHRKTEPRVFRQSTRSS
jgi:FMN phosphatase YigB (HAD superfamily)